jgi:hypothetical protein
MFEFSVEMQGLEVLPKPKVSAKEMGRYINALGFDVYEMYEPSRRSRRRTIL